MAVALPTARPGEIVIQRVTGEGGRLSLDPVKNCAGIAAAATLRAMGAPLACGVGLTLHKGLPLGSGLGSSAASAAAAAVAVNELFGAPLSPMDLVLPGLESEAAVSGYHADNIAPALLGGFVLIRWGSRCRVLGGWIVSVVGGWEARSPSLARVCCCRRQPGAPQC